MVLPVNVAAGHSAAVQPELAAQVNAAVSLYRTRMYGEYHIILFERSEFLIATCKKKITDRLSVCPDVRIISWF